MKTDLERDLETGEFGKIMLIVVVVAALVGMGLFTWQRIQAGIKPYEEGQILDEQNAYVNDYFKIRFQCPDGYKMNRLQISTMDIETAAGNQYEDVERYLDSGQYYPELEVKDTDSFSGMNISVGKGRLSLYNAAFRRKMENYLQRIFSSLGNVSVQVGEPYEDKLANQTYQVLDVNVVASGYPMRATLFVRSKGLYTVMIVVAKVNESTNEIIDGFIAYD
ncbi:MAG: hypothetical protein K6G85_08525 [Eubacterium sp.]|nr:hypothetical protein [Eubacterium sp.]